MEDLIRQLSAPKDLKMVVSNIGVVPDFSSLYTTNAGPYTATIQVALKTSISSSSFEYMDRVQKRNREPISRTSGHSSRAVRWWMQF